MVNVGQRSRARRFAAGRTIVQALWSAVLRTLSNPISLTLAVFTTSYYFLEVLGTSKTGPLENLANSVKTALSAKDINNLEKTLLGLISKLLAFLITHKVKVGVLSAYLVPYSLRPNTTNAVISLALGVLTLCTSTISVKSHYLFALLFWAYTQVNTPAHRSYIATAGLVVILVYFEVILINAVGSVNATSTEHHGRRRRYFYLTTNETNTTGTV